MHKTISTFITATIVAVTALASAQAMAAAPICIAIYPLGVADQPLTVQRRPKSPWDFIGREFIKKSSSRAELVRMIAVGVDSPENYGEILASSGGKSGQVLIPLPQNVVLSETNPWDPFVNVTSETKNIYLMPLEAVAQVIGLKPSAAQD